MVRVVDVPLKATSIRMGAAMTRVELFLFQIMDAEARRKARARNAFKGMLKSAIPGVQMMMAASTHLAPPMPRNNDNRRIIKPGDPKWKQ